MSSISQEVGKQIPMLRRFARALTGNQDGGDSYVRATLEALIADPSIIGDAKEVRVGLYRLFLMVWNSQQANLAASPADPQVTAADSNLQAISARPREAFLLTALEGFSVEEAAGVMSISEAQYQSLLDMAARDIAAQLACEILIIEDEPLIALDVAGLAQSLGHTVRHVARTHREAIAAVAKHLPELVLADIQLADGSSGIDAVQEILRSIDVPVIFITAYPERLLTGKKPEPTYLLAKPYRPETLKALISQALFFHPRQRSGRPI
jgi:CheY-like chemotaxis protein/DNA-directed RNA polymerase specialized sigma24 family protein